jgi:hypothetical protein
MSDIKDLSLQSLYDLIATKADKTHTHAFVGSIESALSLNGITYDKFVRNDLKDQTIKAFYDSVTFGVASNNTIITLKAEDNRARLEIDNQNLDTSNFSISGPHNQDVIMKVSGELLINDSRVLTLNDKNEITGIDFTELDIAGRGILVDRGEPLNVTDGVIWGQTLDEDLVDDETAVANNTLYTVPIGAIIKTLSNVVPNGYLKADGHTVSREGFNGLWTFVKAKSSLVPDEEWKLEKASNEKVLKYSYGDGSTTFRLPNIPTNDDTMYLIKSYDDLSARNVVNLQTMQDSIDEINKSKVVSGIGFNKYYEGGLTQYGVITGSTCMFSIPFIDNSYTIITSYEGSAKNVDITINSLTKSATKCDFIVTNSAGIVMNNAVIHYIAMGRWK